MLNNEEKSLICTEWRDGKHKTLARLEELSQLHACDVAAVCEAVGIDPAKYKGATATRKGLAIYDPALKGAVVQAALAGMPYKEVAEKFSVPKGNISPWVHKAKEKQAHRMDDAEELAKPPVATAKEQVPPGRAFAQKILVELEAGIKGLHAFIDNFSGVDILSDDERDMLERSLYTASGFKEGVETGLALAGWKSSEKEG